MGQSGVEMDRAAADLLFGMIDGGLELSQVEDIVLTPKIVHRDTTAAPTPATY